MNTKKYLNEVSVKPIIDYIDNINSVDQQYHALGQYQVDEQEEADVINGRASEIYASNTVYNITREGGKEANVGDIVFAYDNGTWDLCAPADLTSHSVDDCVPVGVVTIPERHDVYGVGAPGIMAFKCASIIGNTGETMDLNTQAQGCVAATTVLPESILDNTSIYSSHPYALDYTMGYDPAESNTFTNLPACPCTDTYPDTSEYIVNPFDTNRKWPVAYNGNPALPLASPYTQEGTKNLSGITAENDLNGKNNCKKWTTSGGQTTDLNIMAYLQSPQNYINNLNVQSVLTAYNFDLYVPGLGEMLYLCACFNEVKLPWMTNNIFWTSTVYTGKYLYTVQTSSTGGEFAVNYKLYNQYLRLLPFFKLDLAQFDSTGLGANVTYYDVPREEVMSNGVGCKVWASNNYLSSSGTGIIPLTITAPDTILSGYIHIGTIVVPLNHISPSNKVATCVFAPELNMGSVKIHTSNSNVSLGTAVGILSVCNEITLTNSVSHMLPIPASGLMPIQNATSSAKLCPSDTATNVHYTRDWGFYLPSPYIDGSLYKNPAYGVNPNNTSNVFLNGKNQTENMYNKALTMMADPTSLTIPPGSQDYSAARAAHYFTASGKTPINKWYIPTIYELGYFVARQSTILNAMDALINVIQAGATHWNNSISSDFRSLFTYGSEPISTSDVDHSGNYSVINGDVVSYATWARVSYACMMLDPNFTYSVLNP